MATYSSPWISTSPLSSGSKRTRSPTSIDRACGPTAITSAQARRLPPIAAVAGMRMPPLERRSPASSSSSTRIRSCSILIGRLSPDCAPTFVVAPLISGGDLAHQDEQRDRSGDAADDLEDVVRAGSSAGGVDEVGLDRGGLPLRDRLGTGAVHQLVDRARQALAGRLDLLLQRRHVV